MSVRTANGARLFFAAMAAVLAAEAEAADVVVVKPGAVKSPIDVSAFAPGGGRLTGELRETLADDLIRSGWFKVERVPGAALVLAGTAAEDGDGLRFDCSVRNRVTGEKCMEKEYAGDAAGARFLAHKAADDIVLAVRKVPGIACSRIAFIGSRDGRKDLYVCDYDGMRMKKLTDEGAVCLSPSWSPRADALVYTSLHGGFPDVYMVDLRSMARRRIVSFPGLNTGGRISPDGKRLALTLSKDGNADIYIQGLDNRRLARITRTRHDAEASPSWSPDGTKIVFVSNRAGAPHLYTCNADGSDPRRITFRGQENVAPDWGPGGRIAYSSRRGDRYQICVMDAVARQEDQVTGDAADHEDPSWAPDGRHIVYARTEHFRTDLYILDTMGDPEKRLTTAEGDWYSPSWSPR